MNRWVGAVLLQAVALLVLSIIAGVAFGGTITVTITPATQNTDGSPLTDLASHRIEYGTCATGSAFGNKLGETLVPMPAVVQAITANPGTYCLRAYSVNLAGTQSDPSNVASVVVPQPVPRAPTITASLVTTSTVAYTVTNANDRLAFLIVGSVPLGTACDPSQHANGFNVVPRSAVTFDGPAKPTAVLARCQ